MTLSATSTFAEVRAAYRNNAGYDIENDQAKAALFVQACRFLLLDMPRRAAHGGGGAEEIEFDTTILRDEMRTAQRWLDARNTTSTPARAFTFADFGR
jgi:hypothetical protein